MSSRLGRVLVYNARKRNSAGDTAAAYFERTECVAGVQDLRFQDLMPDVFHRLGMTCINRWNSMSNMKFDALKAQGIEVGESAPLPDELIPADAAIEMDAKKAAGYYSDDSIEASDALVGSKGKIAPNIRDLLGKSAREMPLASILEGGTWSAGRGIAAEKRVGGAPPLSILSDGTAF